MSTRVNQPRISPTARVRKGLLECAYLIEEGTINRHVVAHFLRRYAQALETAELASSEVTAEQVDETTIDLPLATALCRQILSGRIREIRWCAVEAIAGTALVLAARAQGKQVRA
jgi:hypothetical protein